MTQWVPTDDVVKFLDRLGLDLSKWEEPGPTYPDIEKQILLAQHDFEEATERSFEYTEDFVEELDGTGTDSFVLRNFPCWSIASVRIIGYPQFSITNFVQDQLNPDLARGIVFLSKVIGGIYPYSIWPIGNRNIRITYTFGYKDGGTPAQAWPLDILDAVTKMTAIQVILQTPSVAEAGALKEFKILNYQQKFDKDGIFGRQLTEWKEQIMKTITFYRSPYMSRPSYIP